MLYPTPQPSRGRTPIKKNCRAARRLALGRKLQNLVPLRVFGMENYYIFTFRYCFVLCIKKFTKSALTMTTHFNLEPHPHWFPIGVKFEFLDEQSPSLLYGSPPWGFTTQAMVKLGTIYFCFPWRIKFPRTRQNEHFSASTNSFKRGCMNTIGPDLK